jgi:putative ABC transport system substrate-binding protein
MIGRREFITLLGGAAAWPLAARAQQGERMRRIGMLLPATANQEEFQSWVGAFLQALALSGWTIGRNMRIDTRWATTDAAEIRKHAAELAALAPDVILAHNAASTAALLQATRTVPIVFAVAVDPVGVGLVDNLARPGGNVTGFMTFEFSIGGKWLELLKQIAPSVTRAAILRDPTQGGGTSVFAAIQAVAPSLRVEVNPINLRDAGEIERAVAAFARSPNGGLIMPGSAAAVSHRGLIIAAGGLLRTQLRRLRRLDLLWDSSDRPVPPRGRLRRSHSQGRETGGPSGAGADQVRDGAQPQDRQSARSRHSAGRARHRRRGD